MEFKRFEAGVCKWAWRNQIFACLFCLFSALSVCLSAKACADFPTISSVPDLVIVANQVIKPISLLVSNVCGQSDAELTLFASSSDESIVAATNIIFVSTGSVRTMTIRPTPGAVGKTDITLNALNKQGAIGQIQFQLTIKSRADAPEISRIQGQTNAVPCAPNFKPLPPISFTIFSPKTAANNLRLTATSSNPGLIPAANIAFGGSGTNRTVTVTPEGNQFGTSAIIVTVTDSDGLSASSAFPVVITFPQGLVFYLNPVPDQVTSVNHGVELLNLLTTCGGIDLGQVTWEARSSDTNLIPVSQIHFERSGTNVSVSLTPASNKVGTATIQILATDSVVHTEFKLTVVPTNSPPTISIIAGQTIAQNDFDCVSFSIYDAETPADLLQLSASVIASPENLLAARNVIFTGTGTNRMVTLIPRKGVIGLALVTIVVRDEGGLTATNQFTFAVSSCGQHLSISRVSDRTITANHSSPPIAFSVAGPCVQLDELTLTGESSNTNLVPDSQIIFAGDGAFRTAMITPTENQIGSTVITLTASDDLDGPASTSFKLTVTAINTPPLISRVSDVELVLNEAPPTLPFVIDDRETPAASLNLLVASSNTNLVPVENIVFNGDGTNRTLTFTPFPCRAGESKITITLSDDENVNVSTDFLVTVKAPAEPRLIEPIADLTECLDCEPGLLPVWIADLPGVNEAKLSGHSSNTNIVRDDGIFFGGQGTKRAAFISPQLYQYGSLNITFTVTYPDGRSGCTTFRYTLVAINSLPTISRIAPQLIPMNSELGPLLFTITDVETGADLLRLKGRSSNTNLVRNSGIVLAGCGRDRVLIVMPNVDAIGTTTITLTATDADGGSTGTQFPLVVSLPNPPSVVFDAVQNEFRVRWSTTFSESVVQASTNLLDWFPVATNQVEHGSLDFVYRNTRQQPFEFFRLLPAR